MDAICAIDVYILLGLLCALRLCTEWLSVRQRWIERGTVVLFTALQTLGYCLNHMAWFSALFLLTAWWMWREARTPDSTRMRRLADAHYGVLRTISLMTYSGLVWLEISAPPHHRGDKLWAAAWVLYILHNYVTALPHNGEPGKKRKLAMEKVKEIFGTDWMVEPVSVPQ